MLAQVLKQIFVAVFHDFPLDAGKILAVVEFQRVMDFVESFRFGESFAQGLSGTALADNGGFDALAGYF